jgi:hypothetical protein
MPDSLKKILYVFSYHIRWLKILGGWVGEINVLDFASQKNSEFGATVNDNNIEYNLKITINKYV